MRHVSLLNSSWQIQQVRLSTWLEFSSVKDNSMRDVSPPWVVAWSATCLFSWKRWLCWLRLKELSTECLLSCCLQVDNRLKHFLQCLQLHGFSKVWVRSCCLQCSNWLKLFLQYWHKYGFSPIQVRSCSLRVDLHLCAFRRVFVAISIKPGYDRLKYCATLSWKTFLPSLTRMLDLTPFQRILLTLQLGWRFSLYC